MMLTNVSLAANTANKEGSTAYLTGYAAPDSELAPPSPKAHSLHRPLGLGSSACFSALHASEGCQRSSANALHPSRQRAAS
jgi:hypothetical protein